MRNWIIFGIVLLAIAVLLSYPWNAVAIVLLSAYAFIHSRRRRQGQGQKASEPFRIKRRSGQPRGGGSTSVGGSPPQVIRLRPKEPAHR